jgi:hypothetical protein
MEARRAFETGAKGSNQLWIVVAALLAVLVLGIAGAFVAKGLSPASATSSGHFAKTIVTGSDPYSPRDSMGAPTTADGHFAPRGSLSPVNR